MTVGYWKNEAEIAEQWQTDRRFESAMKSAPRTRIVEGWERALKQARLT
jgi:glycerol kinase